MDHDFEHWTSWTPKKMTALLGELRKGKSKTAAYTKAMIPRSTFYHWYKQEQDFRTLVDDAIDEGTDRLEDTAHDRATREENPSDTLIIFLLKGRRPDKFRDNSTMRLEGSQDAPLTVTMIRHNIPPETA
jgi:hypothetical protein